MPSRDQEGDGPGGSRRSCHFAHGDPLRRLAQGVRQRTCRHCSATMSIVLIVPKIESAAVRRRIRSSPCDRELRTISLANSMIEKRTFIPGLDSVCACWAMDLRAAFAASIAQRDVVGARERSRRCPGHGRRRRSPSGRSGRSGRPGRRRAPSTGTHPPGCRCRDTPPQGALTAASAAAATGITSRPISLPKLVGTSRLADARQTEALAFVTV